MTLDTGVLEPDFADASRDTRAAILSLLQAGSYSHELPLAERIARLAEALTTVLQAGNLTPIDRIILTSWCTDHYLLWLARSLLVQDLPDGTRVYSIVRAPKPEALS